jgi:PAS domain S-box-containing protein
MSLRALIITALGAAAFVVLLLLVLGFYFSEALKGDSARINTAGHELFLSYRIAWHLEEMAEEGEDVEALKKQVRSDMVEIEATLRGLVRGDPERGVTETKDPEELKALSENLDKWQEVKRVLGEMLTLSPDRIQKEAHKRFDHTLLPDFVSSLHTTVQLMDRSSASKLSLFKVTFAVFTGVSFLTFAGIAALLIRRILRPLSEVAEGIERISEGDFTHRLSVRSEDELGRLAGYYNEMAQKLRGPVNNYRELVETIPDAVVELDREGYISYANEAALAVGGYKSEEMLFKNYIEFVPPPSRDAWARVFNTVLGGETVKNSEQAVNFKDGAGSVEINAFPIWKEKEIVGVRCMLKDIREQKRMMDELVRARENAEEMAKKLRTTVEELEEFALLAVRRELKMQEIKDGLKRMREKRDYGEGSDPGD